MVKAFTGNAFIALKLPGINFQTLIKFLEHWVDLFSLSHGIQAFKSLPVFIYFNGMSAKGIC